MLNLTFSLLVFTLFFALLYLAFKENFSGISSFKDALYYSSCMTTTIGNDKMQPTTAHGKIITILHVLLVFVSVYNFNVMKNSTLTFGAVNVAIIGFFAAIHMFLLSMSMIDAVYHSTMTHTLTGVKEPNHSYTTIAHMIVIFAILFSIPNTGIFGTIISSLGRKKQSYNGLDPSFYK